MNHRGLILSRDAYLGAQRNGTIFWSSDIAPTWDTLQRQVPTGLNFTASGFANWSMRGLFMDFPNDPHVANLGDEYMFGPAFLVAPVTEQGATSRKVYLPAGNDWYDYCTNQLVQGGQTIQVNAPIDEIPLSVRAGSIVPIAAPIESTAQKLTIAKVRVYAGSDSSFTLYDDDGLTYAYEHGGGKRTNLHWNDAAGKLTHDGSPAWTNPDADVIEVVGRSGGNR